MREAGAKGEIGEGGAEEGFGDDAIYPHLSHNQFSVSHLDALL